MGTKQAGTKGKKQVTKKMQSATGRKPKVKPSPCSIPKSTHAKNSKRGCAKPSLADAESMLGDSPELIKLKNEACALIMKSKKFSVIAQYNANSKNNALGAISNVNPGFLFGELCNHDSDQMKIALGTMNVESVKKL